MEALHHYVALLPDVHAHAAAGEGAALLSTIVTELAAVSAVDHSVGTDYPRVRRAIKLLVRAGGWLSRYPPPT